MDLNIFLQLDFLSALKEFFKGLKVPVNYIADEPVAPQNILSSTYRDSEAFQLMNDVYFVGMVDDASFTGNKSPDITNITMANQSTTLGQADLRFMTTSSLIYQIEEKLGNNAYSIIKYHTSTVNGIFNFQRKNCNTQDSVRTFRIRTNDACSNTSIYSAEISTIPYSITVNSGQNQINWSTYVGHTFNRFDIYRDGLLYASSVSNSYNDNAVVCNQNYCYKIIGVSNGRVSVISTRL